MRRRLILSVALLFVAGSAGLSLDAGAKPAGKKGHGKKSSRKPEKTQSDDAASADPVEIEPEVEPERYDIYHEPPWRWRQVLATPRIGGRMTLVAVDPTNRDRIFVGTEEGTLIRSVDGGVTWDERPLSPFVVQARSIGLAQVDEPDLSNKGRKAYDQPSFGDAESAAFDYSLSTPDMQGAADIALLFDSVIFDSFPTFFSTNIPPAVNDTPPTSTLLQDAIQSREDEQVPVRSIAICPGATFPLLVATTQEVYGSADDGITSLRLFFITGNITIEQMTCSRRHPNEIAVATNAGLFLSRDGGISFNLVLTGWPGAVATAVAFGVDPKTGKTILYQAAEEELYAGDPDSEFGLEYKYPEQTEPTAPWKTIHGIATTEDGEVWLATEDGLRVSRDYGEKFSIAGPQLFNGQAVSQVHVGVSDSGGRRITALIGDALYASDDDGAHWFTFFHGATRRTLRQASSGGVTPEGVARWWMVTTGELYTTVPPQESPDVEPVRQARAWARHKLERTPSLYLAIARVLDETKLSPRSIDGLIQGEHRRRYIPQIDLKVVADNQDFGRGLSALISNPLSVQENTSMNHWQVFLQVSWPVPDGFLYPEEISPIRNALYEMRRQIAFAAEDAWHERVQNLKRIAGGMGEPTQIEVMRARIEALEVVLNTWGWMKPLPEELTRGQR